MKVYSERLKREIHFIEGGTSANTYTRPELELLVAENKRSAFTDGELLRIDAFKRTFKATVSGIRKPDPYMEHMELFGKEVQKVVTERPKSATVADLDDEAW